MMQTMSRWKMRAAIAIVFVLTIFCIDFGQAGTANGHEKIYITGVTPIKEEIAVEYNTPWEEVLAQLPKETTITVSKGDPIPVSLNWTSESEYGEYMPGIRGLYLLTGTFELPDGVYQPNPPIDLKVELIIQQLGSEPLTIDDPIFNQPGAYLKKEMMHSGQQRTYYYYLPSSIEHSNEPLPLLVLLHGGGSYALGQLSYTGFDAIAEKENFIILAPDYGSSAFGNFTNDIAFISDIIDQTIKEYNVDERRIYATGISMGGSTSISLAYELPDKIAAIAPVSIGPNRLMREPLPFPKTVIYMAGSEERIGSPVTRDFLPAVRETASRLVAQNRTSTIPKITNWDATEIDPTSIKRSVYNGGIFDTEVIAYEVERGGHTWPGKYQYASILSVGLTSQHIDASEQIWEHLKTQKLPIAADMFITPAALNVNSKGKWVQAHVKIPGIHDPVEEVVLTYNGKSLAADEFKPLNGKVQAKFNRSELISMLSEADGAVELRTGVKIGDEWFTAVDKITLKGK